MIIHDISQEVFSCTVFPGDPSPTFVRQNSITNGDLYNLTMFSMCAHNGTHLDAPFHFIDGGKTVEELDLSRCVGWASVVSFQGELCAQDIAAIHFPDGVGAKRLLIKGKATVTLEAAREINRLGIVLVGIESQSVGPEGSPMAVHLELLGKEVVLLEGLRLADVADGNYLLVAAPLNLGGSDGSPCRAILIEGIAS